MPVYILVERGGSLREITSKTHDQESLYKKAGFKTANGFDVQCKFNYGKIMPNSQIIVYAKSSGRANTENKYDFPPPIDTTLFYGNCLLVHVDKETKEVKDISIAEWEKIYERLFGGFEDLSGPEGAIVADIRDRILDMQEMTEEEKRIMKDPNTKFTKQGYVKDGFIVDDEDDDADYEEEENSVNISDDDCEDDSSVETPPSPPKKNRKPRQNQKNSKELNSSLKSTGCEENNSKRTRVCKSTKDKTETTRGKRSQKAGTSSKTKSAGKEIQSNSVESQEQQSYEFKDELIEETYFES